MSAAHLLELNSHWVAATDTAELNVPSVPLMWRHGVVSEMAAAAAAAAKRTRESSGTEERQLRSALANGELKRNSRDEGKRQSQHRVTFTTEEGAEAPTQAAAAGEATAAGSPPFPPGGCPSPADPGRHPAGAPAAWRPSFLRGRVQVFPQPMTPSDKLASLPLSGAEAGGDGADAALGWQQPGGAPRRASWATGDETAQQPALLRVKTPGILKVASKASSDGELLGGADGAARKPLEGLLAAPGGGRRLAKPASSYSSKAMIGISSPLPHRVPPRHARSAGEMLTVPAAPTPTTRIVGGMAIAKRAASANYAEAAPSNAPAMAEAAPAAAAGAAAPAVPADVRSPPRRKGSGGGSFFGALRGLVQKFFSSPRTAPPTVVGAAGIAA